MKPDPPDMRWQRINELLLLHNRVMPRSRLSRAFSARSRFGQTWGDAPGLP